MSAEHWKEMEAYVGFDDEDRALLRGAAPLIEPHVDAVVDHFYDVILKHPGARSVLTGPEQVERLKVTLRRWIRELFVGPWDDAYWRGRQRIGRTHVRVGLPERFMFTAMAVFREDIIERLRREVPAEQGWKLARALNRVTELELAVMTTTYMEAHEQAELRSLQDLIVRNMPVTVLCLDANGTVNAATRPSTRLFGFRDRTGHHYEDYLPAELIEAADLPTHIGRALATGAEVTIHRVVLGAPGSTRYFRINLVPLEHDLARLLVHVEELTDTVQAEVRVQQSEALARIGSLAANVAHEIRNPLTAISATLQVIGNSLPSDDRRRGIIDKVNGQVLRLDRLVTDLLSYARPPEPRMAVQGLEAVAREAVGQVAAPATVRTDTDALVYCDAHYVQQVLVNLVQNAADAAGPGGRVEIQVGPGAELRVADDGPGIAPDARDRLFEAFFTTKPRGTGLGLAISRKLCESMGGSLELMAGGGLGPDGRGACFRLTLPAASDHASPSDSGGRSD